MSILLQLPAEKGDVRDSGMQEKPGSRGDGVEHASKPNFQRKTQNPGLAIPPKPSPNPSIP